MTITIEATFEKGVFVPMHRPALAEHERVRVLVEPIGNGACESQVIRARRSNRIRIDAELSREIAASSEFAPEENHPRTS